MACELTAWMTMLALDGPARAWEPKRLRLRLFRAAGRIVRGGRRLRLHTVVAVDEVGRKLLPAAPAGSGASLVYLIGSTDGTGAHRTAGGFELE